MKDNGKVIGSSVQAVPLIVSKTTVYVHSNIEPYIDPETSEVVEGLFQYDEIVYGKDEYIEMVSVKNDTNESIIDALLDVNLG